MANTKGEKELKTDWPVTDGITAGTQKQTGRQMNLVREEGTTIPIRNKVGLG